MSNSIDGAVELNTEVSVLIPRREHRKRWHRLLHDNTAGRIADAVARVPHTNVTFVPYHFGEQGR